MYTDTLITKPYRLGARVENRDTGEVIAEVASWHEPDGTEIADPARIAELEATMPTNDELRAGDRVRFPLGRSGEEERMVEGWIAKGQNPAESGVVFVRLADGSKAGVPVATMVLVEPGEAAEGVTSSKRRCTFCGGDGVLRKSDVSEDDWDERARAGHDLTTCPICSGSGELEE